MSRQRAFTLTELVVVLFLLSVGITILLNSLGSDCGRRSPRLATKSQLRSLKTALSHYHSETRLYPGVVVGAETQPGGDQAQALCATLIRQGAYPAFEARELGVRTSTAKGRPLTEAELQDLQSASPSAALLERIVFVDPLGQPLRYRLLWLDPQALAPRGNDPRTLSECFTEGPSGQGDMVPVLWSIGPNGIDEEGGGDDLASWHD